MNVRLMSFSKVEGDIKHLKRIFLSPISLQPDGVNR